MRVPIHGLVVGSHLGGYKAAFVRPNPAWEALRLEAAADKQWAEGRCELALETLERAEVIRSLSRVKR